MLRPRYVRKDGEYFFEDLVVLFPRFALVAGLKGTFRHFLGLEQVKPVSLVGSMRI